MFEEMFIFDFVYSGRIFYIEYRGKIFDIWYSGRIFYIVYSGRIFDMTNSWCHKWEVPAAAIVSD